MSATSFAFRGQAMRTALLVCLGVSASGLRAQSEDGGQTFEQHQAVLQSIEVPHTVRQPFRLKLLTEWVRTAPDGRTFTVVNERPIVRDGEGRLYQERWLLAPRNSRAPLHRSWIQIADPVAHTLLECAERSHICYLERWNPTSEAFDPNLLESGPTHDGKWYREHISLGGGTVLGIPVQQFRDLETMLPRTPKSPVTVRTFSYAPSLSLNLRSVVESATLGQQTFLVSEIALGEPDARYFRTPDGFRVEDRRDNPLPEPAITH